MTLTKEQITSIEKEFDEWKEKYTQHRYTKLKKALQLSFLD